MKTMNRLHNERAFTLAEVLVSVGIMLLFLPFAAYMLTNSQLLCSYAKHKIQAAYVARQLIEAQRQTTFVSLAAGKSESIPTTGSNAVILDTKGNYTSVTCSAGNTGDFCGTEVMTITPAVYTSTTGTTSTNTSVDHVVVTVSWVEQIANLKVPMTETYAEDIVNDTMLN